MADTPQLVLQMQRLGDLILTFPLLRLMIRQMPDHPVWVAAETLFFRELHPLAPPVTFFAREHCDVLARDRGYIRAVNLSSRPEAVRCMGALRAAEKWGMRDEGGVLRVDGFWHLYRAALTQNNENNAFHWADMYALDFSADGDLRAAGVARLRSAGTGRIGLVLGASEDAKRPDAEFWASLARRLTRDGLRCLFIGGPAERELGAAVAARTGLHQANYCGRLDIPALAGVMTTLDLCVSPDTGPMHLADLLGVPVLNLSMGPVHACETGPRSPGHWILRAGRSCVGCWQCRRGGFPCRRSFLPGVVADAVRAFLKGGGRAPDHPFPGLRLHVTERDSLGLYRLRPLLGGRTAREDAAEFWRRGILAIRHPSREADARSAAANLAEGRPRLAASLERRLADLHILLARHAARGTLPPADFWRGLPPLIRLFAGFLILRLQNADGAPAAWEETLADLERVRAWMRG